MADRADAINPATLLRRRFRRLRRFTMLSLCLLLAAIAVRIEWGRIAERRIQSFLGDAKSRGEPIALEDLKVESVPEDSNGAFPIFQAAQETVIDHDGYQWLRIVSAARFPVTGQDLLIWNKLLSDNQHALQIVRRARMMPAFGSIESKVRNPATQFRHAVVLAQLLERMAIVAGNEGRESDAVDDIMDILAIGRAVRMQARSQDSFRISSESIDSYAFAAISPILFHPSVENASQQRKIRKLIAQLSEENEECFAFEQSCYFYGIQRISPNAFTTTLAFEHPLLDSWLEPASRLNALRDAKTDFDVARSTKDRPIRYDAIRAGLHPRDLRDGPWVRRWLSLYDPQDASIWRLQLFCHYLTLRRMCRSGLALHLYSSDHGGQPPPNLDALVPEYMSAVPLDPSGQDDHKIGAIFWNNAAVWKHTVELTCRDGNCRIYVSLPKTVDQDSNVSVNQRNDDKGEK